MINLSAWLVVVPARLNAQRLPRKPLVPIAGVPLIVRVWENLRPLSNRGARVVVATDSSEVEVMCSARRIPVELTSPDHPSGSDRCWEVAARHSQQLILNVQGDEPFIACDDLHALMRQMESTPAADIGTLAFSSRDAAEIASPHTVKVVTGNDNWALYFSRAPIPYWREVPVQPAEHLLHVGVYAFRRAALQRFCHSPMGRLEAIEKLEQLRALENAMRILVAPASRFGGGIDTLADVIKAEQQVMV